MMVTTSESSKMATDTAKEQLSTPMAHTLVPGITTGCMVTAPGPLTKATSMQEYGNKTVSMVLIIVNLSDTIITFI